MWFLFWKAKCLAKFEGSITICLQCRRPVFDPWVRRTPGEGNGYALQYSCLESSMDRGAWRAGYSPWHHNESDITE